MAVLVAGCKKKNADILVPVHFIVNDFSISQDTIPSKGDIPGYTGVKAVTLAFFKSDNTEQYNETQFRNDPTTYTTFGDFSLSLPMGSYTMVVLGYGLNDGEPGITLTSPTSATFGDYPARETFVATQEVNIENSNTAVELEATLSRKIAKVNVVSTDGRTENANSLKMTFSAGGKSFNPTTGLATTNAGFSNTVSLGMYFVGDVTGSISYIFLNADEQTVNMEIDVLDEDGVSVAHREVTGVPLKRNRLTTLRGSLYEAGMGTDFDLDQDWITSIEVPF